MNNRNIIFGAIVSVLACFVLSPQMRAAPETFLNSNTWDGFGALANGVASNTFNTAEGWESLHFQTAGLGSTGVGAAALAFNTAGTLNTAVGGAALALNASGSNNNAFGGFALFHNTTAFFNNAHGREALFANTTGGENDAFGDLALLSVTTGSMNTAMGDNGGFAITTGSGNTAMGKDAGSTITTGSNNTAIGHSALVGTITASNNIAIGVPATGPFANLPFTCWIGSIHGQPTSNIPSTTPVFVDSNNVVGGIVSSRRAKHDIIPIDKASEVLYALEPISFIYNFDETNTRLVGLIAEDVAKVNPNLVAWRDGKPFTVKYDQVDMMLLNEFLKEHRKVEQLEKQVEALTVGLQKVSDQLEVSKPALKTVLNNP